MCARTRTLSRGCVQSIRSRLVAAGSGARRAPSSWSRRLNAGIERRCRFLVSTSSESRASWTTPRTKEPVVHDGTRDDDDDDGETRVLSQRCGDRTCSAANSRQGHTRLTLARCVAREDEVASRRRASERARRRESEEYEGKSRRERDRTKRGKNMSLTKGRGRKRV